MLNDPARPAHLPDFHRPPLNEVVLGVQFEPPKGYSQIYAGEVWNLYRKEFPNAEEQPPILPAFETFGLPSQGGQLGITSGTMHDRYWFLRLEGDELIQFQLDRLLHNWRKVGDRANVYPRFESMIKRFRGELSQLQNYVNKLSPQMLSINQCEISYINHIEPINNGALKTADWLRFVMLEHQEPDDFSFSFREILRDSDKTPYGRLICDASIGIKPSQQRIIVLSLAVRGTPKKDNVESALDFLTKGRELIVNKFAEITTDKAHKIWERVK